MIEDNKAIKVLVKEISQACKQYISSASFDKTIKAVVMGKVVNSEYLYKVKIQGVEHTIPSTVMIDKFPCQVWVTVPCGNYNDMFVSGVRY